MKLYVLRHGLALTITEAKVSQDADRPLADIGRADVRAMAAQVKAQGGAVEAILCSPLKRAQETAQEAAAVLKPKAGVKVFEPLANQVPGEELLDAIKTERPKASALMVVGHQPQLGEMVSHLLGTGLDIRPGGLVALDLDSNGKAKLLWNKNP